MFEYAARPLRVIDGDTFWARIDLGFRAFLEHAVRMEHLWCPELNEPGGPEARLALNMLLFPRDGEAALRLRSKKAGTVLSFDRYVFEAWIVEPDGSLTDVADSMIMAGHGTRERA